MQVFFDIPMVIFGPARVMPHSSLPTDPLHLKLNQETARLHWAELQRFFAAGLVVVIDDTLDLIDVAVAFTNDEKVLVQQWIGTGKVAKASDADAESWLTNNAQLWTVVVRPWILVQQNKPLTSVAADAHFH